jgi:nitrogen PTS system EIIA component
MQPLSKEAIILEMKAATKESALRELAGAAATVCGRFTEETLYNVLLEREAVGSTGVGNGVAIPHGKIAGLDSILVCFGRSREGIDFDAIDNRPVHLFVLLLSPAAKATEYLRALAGISRMLKHNGNRERLLDSTSKEEILALFAGEPEAR